MNQLTEAERALLAQAPEHSLLAKLAEVVDGRLTTAAITPAERRYLEQRGRDGLLGKLAGLVYGNETAVALPKEASLPDGAKGARTFHE